MTSVRVVRGGDPVALEGPLFVDPRFVAYQAAAQGKPLVSFSAVDTDGRLLAGLSLAAGPDGVWTSPITGAFGGVSAAEPTSAAVIFAVAEAASDWLTANRAGARLRLPPDCFASPSNAALENVLFRLGWRLDQSDLNYHFPIGETATFAAGLGETKQKEIRRLHRSGAAFALLPVDAGEKAYRVIAENRATRGFPMTMTWPQVQALAEALPDRVSFASVERGDEVLAGAICLRLSADHLYVFYWGEAPAFRRESPVMLLAEGLVARCAAEGVRVLDLGTSTDNSVPNPGLVAFKEGLGCLASSKRTYAFDPA